VTVPHLRDTQLTCHPAVEDLLHQENSLTSCDCRGLPGGPPALVADTEHVARTELDSPVTKDDPETSDIDVNDICTPGMYRCAHRTADTIEVCGQDQKWYLSASCCGLHTCRMGLSALDWAPRCHCGHVRSVDTSAPATAEREVIQPEPSMPEPCQPWTRRCGVGPDAGSLYMCGEDNKWTLATSCDCQSEQTGQAYCGPTMSSASDPPYSEPTPKPFPAHNPSEPEPCEVYTMCCGAGEDFRSLYMCGYNGRWGFANDCLGGRCVRSERVGKAYCLEDSR